MRVAIAGSGGRMGILLTHEISLAPDLVLAAGTVRPGSAQVGRDLGTLAGIAPVGVMAGDDPVALFADSDAVIDFSPPAEVARHCALARPGTALVIGTTGLNQDQQRALATAAVQCPIVFAANMSLGVALLKALVATAAARLGPDWDIGIIETHHRHKVDAPSGTALTLGKAAAAARGIEPDAIDYASLRGGDVVGDHTVVFAGPAERLELTHRAHDRVLFAKGAIHAARWAVGKAPGLYGIEDVLGL